MILIHEDIYSTDDGVGLLLHLRYIADLVIRVAPLSTGLAADVHGQVRFLFTTSRNVKFLVSYFLASTVVHLLQPEPGLILKDGT